MQSWCAFFDHCRSSHCRWNVPRNTSNGRLFIPELYHSWVDSFFSYLPDLKARQVLVYASVVLVMAATAATRGRDVWLSSVKDSFGSLAGPVEYPMAQHKLHNPASTV